MELKRYVLDTKRVIIFDLQNNDDVKRFNMITKNYSHFINGAYKTSNNILDLAEVGDMVEILHTGNDIYYKLEITKIDDFSITTSHMVISLSNFYGYTSCRGGHLTKLPFVKNIYKAKPNGDYKKYEVVQ